MSQQRVEIFSKDNCTYCVKAKQTLEQLGVSFVERKLGKDLTREELFERAPSARTMPQIFINGESIGGYYELVKYIENTGFNGTGHSIS
tara:strand:- start:2404 stop:2670 length:267 start_codon:yes stop_codon:yes gene_type:complete